MSSDLKETAIERIQQGDYLGALDLFTEIVRLNPDDWNTLYLIGQCHRFTGKLEEAVQYLNKALKINSEDAPIWQALGIAEQQRENYDLAVSAFKKAINIEPNYDLAYNSLALTHKMAGDIQIASDMYDEGLRALSRKLVLSMKNDESSQIFKHSDFGRGVWLEYAMSGAVYLAALDDTIGSVSFPTGEMAINEEQDETHKGLFWAKKRDLEGGFSRLYLPNFFNTFLRMLFKDRAYMELIGNRSVVLEMLRETEEAENFRGEAEDFLSVLNDQ